MKIKRELSMRSNKSTIKNIARERVEKLFTLSKTIYSTDPQLSKRYVDIALNICKKANLRLPLNDKLRICKKCKCPMIPGLTCRTRTRPEHNSKLIVTCLDCGNIKRIPLGKKKKRKNSSM